MSKKRKVKVFSFQGFDVAHYKTTEQFAALVSTLYDKATAEIAQVAANGSYKANKHFSFADYPKVGAVINNIVGNLTKNVEAVISVGARKQWLFACQKNDEFLKSIIDTSRLTKQQATKYQDRNLDALKSFQDRKVGGMNLSQRVWKYTEQYKEQIEIALDVGLGEGKSAAQLSRDVRQNLNDPDRLFKRVQDKRGNLQLSKSAKVFHPGTGVYRSAYKNAMRLTRSEINMAYRESDWLRWQQLDFVVGFEVKRSNREPVCECKLCERLVGKYPKWFKFKGWHPQCLCHAIPIIDGYGSKERSEDRRNALRAALYGTEYKKYVSPNTIIDLPDEFKAWVSENMERQNNWASTPYFIRDNFKNGKLSEGLKYVPNAKLTPEQPNILAVVGVPHPAILKKYDKNEEVDETFRRINAEMNPGERWFERGDLHISSTTKRGVNGFTYMDGRISLKSDRLAHVKSAMAKIGQGKSQDITFGEADAMATFWHEITHNRNVHGNMHITRAKTDVMEMMNEFVARKTLPDFYKKLGCATTPYPEFITNRASTGYNRFVLGYDFVITRLGLDFDKVLLSAKNNLFTLKYTEQETTALQALIDGGLDDFKGANGKKIGKMQLKKIVAMCWKGYSTTIIENYLKKEGIIPDK